ncbi:uncharacterized protein LOC120330002 [Styela clava]
MAPSGLVYAFGLLLVCIFIASSKADCPPGYWGEKCVNYCGHCKGLQTTGNCTTAEINSECQNAQESRLKKGPSPKGHERMKYTDDYDRNCTSDGKCSNGCRDGWEGERCDKPICQGGCGNGECLFPDYCGNCGGKSYISPNCIDIRIRGLKAAAVSLAILSVILIFIDFFSELSRRVST